MDNNKAILWVVMIALTLLMTYFVTNSYQLYVTSSKYEVLHKLDEIVRNEAPRIDGDFHEQLHRTYANKDDIQKNEDDAMYSNLQKHLLEIQSRYQLENPVYTLVYDSLEDSFEFLGTSLSTPNFRHDHVKFSHSLLENHENGGIIDVYEDENGKWLSAYSPIKNKNGETVALLVADEPFSHFIKQARIHLLLYIFIFLLISAALIAMMLHLLKKEKQVKHELIESHQEVHKKSIEIERQSTDLKEKNSELESAQKIIKEKVKQLKLNNQLLDIKVDQRTDSLEKLNKELNILLYRISHDVLGPIATIQGLCYLGKIEVKDEVGSHYIGKMSETNEKLIGIIKNINHAYSIKNKDLDYQEVQLFEIVDHIQTKTLEKNDVHINIVNKVEHGIKVNTDQFILESAIVELMQNAFTFRDREKEESTLTIEAEKWGENHIRMTFADNGIGINGATQQEIFDMFNKDTAYSSGLGLGLYIVKDSLKKLKGNARLIESKGGETVFEIQFPI